MKHVENMKRIVLIIIAVLTMTTINSQRLRVGDGTSGMTLTERQKGLAVCACLMAQGDLTRLEPAVRMALDNGVTINEMKEAFSQLYAYTGFPRSLNALGVLNKVLESSPSFGGSQEGGSGWQEGKPWTRPAEWDDARIFAGDQLSAADREIVTVAALSGLEGVAPQLAAHKQGAVNMGNSQQLVDELCAWLGSQGYTLLSKWPKGEPNPYGKYFIGQSYLADVGGGVMNVTFEPRCRNNWHVHHKQVQVLICVAGRGWYQEWGKEAVEMTPGTVIAIPAEAKHWHGAAKDSWFQHLTYHKDVQEGASNEWLEPVTDEVYDKLK